MKEILISFGLTFIFIIGYIAGLITAMLLLNYFNKLNKQTIIKVEEPIETETIQPEKAEINKELKKTDKKVSLTDEIINEWQNGAKDGGINE